MLVKLQKIQSLESFVLMAIQGTQVPMYTNTLFLHFSDFSIFFYMKNKINQNWKENKQKQVKQSNA